MSLTGKVALVTGASGGIGRDIALELASNDARVVVCYRSDRDGAVDTVGRIRAQGHSAEMIHAALVTEEDCRALITEASNFFGPIDVLINNAAANSKAPFLEIEFETARHEVTSNFLVPLFLTQEVARRLIDEKLEGRIVNISSIRGQTVQTGRTSYCCSKAALDMLTQTSALELAPHGIRVNGVAPGLTDAGMNAAIPSTDPETWAGRVQRVPLGRAGAGADIARAVVFLVSDDSGWTTGTTVRVDGGHCLVSF